MRFLIASIAAFVIASGTAEAQGPPRDCGMYFGIKGGAIQAPVPTPTTKIECNFEGSLIALVQNFDEAEYTLTFESFRLSTASPSLCGATNPVGNHPGKAPGRKMIFHIKPNEIGATPPRKLKVKGANAKECYKFTIRLEDENGVGTTIDPELEVADPPPPPPGVEVKKPPVI